MKPKFTRAQAVTGIIVAAMCAAAGIGDLAASQPALAGALPKQSLFAIAASMQSTTGSMLTHTKGLQGRVQTVNQELNQLSKQEQILTEQQQTSQNMASALTTQQQLTAHGVSLMQSILTREKVTRSITGNVAKMTSGLSNNVLDSETELSGLSGSIVTSGQESVQLNGQMDQLLSALDTSLQEFRIFGQVDQLLKNPLGKGSLLPSLAQSATGTLTKTATKAAGSTVGAVQNATNSVVGNTLGNTLGNPLNILGGLGHPSN